jgi:small subunit ribosomal protein S3Ae
MGHSLTSDYIRRLTRRKHSKTDGVFDVRTKDKALIRVKPMAVTDKRIQVAQQRALRAVMNKITIEIGKKKTTSEFVRDIISGNLSKDILKACKAVYPLKRVEIRKSEVLEMPTIDIKPEKEETEEKEEIEEAAKEAEPAKPAEADGEIKPPAPEAPAKTEEKVAPPPKPELETEEKPKE